ncbi:winged helix-turn-helix transcriptional regulator [Candidatus Saccharibacteria bacterium]|nr:winged helix-turn-helix transcriptional regulator [Candidatus Saccharibacteria bacterium]
MLDNLSEEELLIIHRGFYVFGDSTSLKILYELNKFGDKNFSDLRDHLNINPASLSKKLKVLIEVGLVVADRTHDNLRVFYSIGKHRRALRKFLESFEKISKQL